MDLITCRVRSCLPYLRFLLGRALPSSCSFTTSPDPERFSICFRQCFFKYQPRGLCDPENHQHGTVKLAKELAVHPQHTSLELNPIGLDHILLRRTCSGTLLACSRMLSFKRSFPGCR
jgi:hypothetical protein